MVKSRVENLISPKDTLKQSRLALLVLSSFVDQSQHFLCSNGRWFIMKGTYPTEELQAIEQLIWVTSLARARFNISERHLVEIKNSSNCHSQPKGRSR
ncbi:hypothetical protein [Coxiella-like endosymbiont]|uniref:hypothetical protein n=1 Tax=Coxiella-like endosymbiont TaxID=1592897 RepID=UPI0034E26C2E